MQVMLPVCFLVLLMLDSGLSAPTPILEEEHMPSAEPRSELKLATVSALVQFKSFASNNVLYIICCVLLSAC